MGIFERISAIILQKQPFLLCFEDYWIIAADFKRSVICLFNIKIVRPFSLKMIMIQQLHQKEKRNYN